MKALLFGNKWLYLSAVLVVAVLIYYPGLAGGFFFDDKPNIVDNPSLRLFNGSLLSLISASTNGIASPLGRPLSMASFALNLHFFGDSPFSFKLVNLLIHLANGVLVFVLVQQVWSRLTGEARSSIAAIWVAAVWLLHPINLVPVLFVVQRMTSLAAFFSLAALTLYLFGRQAAGGKGWITIAVAILMCWPAAILSKETALLLPLFVILCEWLVLGGFRSVSSKVLWIAAFVLGITVIGILVAEWPLVSGGYKLRDFGLVDRLMTESRVLWFYVLQLSLPWPDFFSLHHDDFTISRGLLSPAQTLLAIVSWIAVIALAIYHHKRTPLFSFGLLWFLAAHALESTILPLEIAYEHRNYLASLGILMLLAGLLFTPFKQEQSKLPRLVLAASFAIFCALIAMLRASQWGDEYRRTLIEAAVHPNSARANYEAGIAVIERTFLSASGGNALAYQTAQFHLKRAAELDHTGKAPSMGLLYLDCLAGYPSNPGLQGKLRERFSSTPFVPGDRVVVQSLSQLLVENRLCLDDDEVKKLLNAALSNPAADGAMRGMLYAVAMDYASAKIGSPAMALGYAKAAVGSDPGSIPLRINLIHLLLASSDQAASLKEYTALANLSMAPRDKADFEKLSQKFQSMEQNANKH